ncbi:DUF3742 family protein [Burkholderia aenigmatica]|uniref:DUF3742 family protein n=1 Tax=Burkholderia aenigmatica TaxID=2015348 RepID=UPI001F41D425|nr:DUF3742 family protein [Burkholderia aenigmatica]UKD17393.1 DUF3742 family protein [Burkholderia aenigmatica]
MQNTRSPTFAERAGRAVGRWLKPAVRLENAIVRHLVVSGVPRPLAVALKWIVRLAIALGMLYFAFVPALIVLFLFVLVLGSGGTGIADDEDWSESFYFHYEMQKNEEARKAREEEDEQQRRDDEEWWGQ